MIVASCMFENVSFRVSDPEEGAGLRDPVFLPPGAGGQGPGGGHCPLCLHGHLHTGNREAIRTGTKINENYE
jgi:hypothetical protein